MSEILRDIRKKIDALDDQIHDLLMQRADLIVDVSREKNKNNIQIVQPAREAMMIRRLLKRHRPPLPEIVIIRIWRELVGAVSLLQTGLKVAVSHGESHTYCWDMAKEYFGSVLPMTRVPAPAKAVSMVHDDLASFAVLPWPQDGEEAPWWPFLANGGDNGLKILCALPYDSGAQERSQQQGRALIISKSEFLESGEDNSFIGIEIDGNVSRTKIIDVIKSLGVEPLSINSVVDGQGRRTLHFVEISGYIGANHALLNDFVQQFDGHSLRVMSLGGYPVLPVLRTLKVEPLLKSGTTGKAL